MQHAERFHGVVVVVQRLTHPHQHDVERGIEQLRRRREDAHLSRDLASRQVPHEPHLPGEAEPACHGASDLRRDAERHRRCVRDEDRLDLAMVGELEDEFAGAVDRLLVADNARRGDDGVLLQPDSQRPRQVGHAVDVGDAALVDPAVELPCMEALPALRFECGLEFGKLQLGQIRTGGGGHLRIIRPGGRRVVDGFTSG